MFQITERKIEKRRPARRRPRNKNSGLPGGVCEGRDRWRVSPEGGPQAFYSIGPPAAVKSSTESLTAGWVARDD